jgi:hypothetical protein
MISVVPYSIEMKCQWDEFADTCKNGTFLLFRNFMDYHSDRFRDHSMMIYDDDRLVALFPANIRCDGVVASHDGLTYGGLLVRKHEYSQNTITYFKALLEHLNRNDIQKIIFKQIPSLYCSISCEEIDYALGLANARIERVDLVSAIEINSPDRIKYQRRRCSGINKARENNISALETDDFSQFWNEILTPNLEARYCVRPIHTLQEIQQLDQDNPGKIRQFCAYYDNRIMAGCTVFETDHVAHIQYFSGCGEGRRNGSLDFLVNYLLTDIYQEKKYLDFGNSNRCGWKNVNNGLLDWKEGFGARSYAQRFYEVETAAHQLIEDVFV